MGMLVPTLETPTLPPVTVDEGVTTAVTKGMTVVITGTVVVVIAMVAASATTTAVVTTGIGVDNVVVGN